MKKSVIRVGDTVKLIAATEFIRCGYEATIQTEAERFSEEKAGEIDDFIDLIFGVKGRRENLDSSAKTIFRRRTFDRIASALAYGSIALKSGKGGTRRLFLNPMHWQIPKGIEGIVTETKIVKTSKWTASYSSYNPYDGDYDYEPTYFSNEKTYKVLTVNWNDDYHVCKVLSMHVEKIK